MKQYFKLNYKPKPKIDGGGVDAEVKQEGSRTSVTIGGAPAIPKGMRVPNPHEGIRDLAGGSNDSDGGGFLSKRFNR